MAEFHDNLSQCRPNSYVFVKAIAEHLIHRLAKPELPNYRPIPVALIRPSIVLPAVSEPVPGWVDSINGPLSMLLLSSVGIMVTSNYDYAIRPDTISVDHLANFMLCAAWFQCSKCKPTNYHHENSVTSELVTVKNYASDTNIFMDESLDINDLLGDKISPLDTNTDETDGNFTIYNFTASGLNSSTTSCHDLLKYGHEICLSSPSLWTIRPNTVPSINNNKPGWMFSIEKFVYHFLYALLLDIMFWLTGHKPR